MAYSRLFIALNQSCPDYAKDTRGCVGRCIIEQRNSTGRLVFQVQGLSSEADYRVVLLGEDKCFDIPKRLYLDGGGKGEIRWNFDPQTLEINLEDIRAAAVLVMDKAPLIGFTKGEYNWQKCLMAKEVRAAEADPQKAEVISIIEKLDESIKDIRTIINSSDKKDNQAYVFDKEHIKPFGEDNIAWVKGSLKEMTAVKDLWKYANNPYVVYSCCKYKHILLGKDSDGGCWLALPCKYDKTYALEARLQGFKGFKAVDNGELKDNEFCYCLLKC